MGFVVSIWTTTSFSVSVLPPETFPLIQRGFSISGSNMAPSFSEADGACGPTLAAVPEGHVCPLQYGFYHGCSLDTYLAALAWFSMGCRETPAPPSLLPQDAGKYLLSHCVLPPLFSLTWVLTRLFLTPFFHLTALFCIPLS